MDVPTYMMVDLDADLKKSIKNTINVLCYNESLANNFKHLLRHSYKNFFNDDINISISKIFSADTETIKKILLRFLDIVKKSEAYRLNDDFKYEIIDLEECINELGVFSD